MPSPTLQNVYDATRAAIGDDSVAGGEVYVNALLAEPYKRAYRAMYRAMATLGTPKIERDVYFVVPANTNYISPATAGIADMKDPTWLAERGNLTKKTITGASGTSTVTVTAVAHGFQTGNIVTINQVGGMPELEGNWAITVSDADHFVLNGCVGSGTYTSGGVAVYSPEEFVDMDRTRSIDQYGVRVASPRFSVWSWENDAFHVIPCASDRQLHISYWASGNPPTSTSANLGIDDCQDLLATLTAGYATQTRNPEMSKQFKVEALGPSMDETVPGGLLLSFLQSQVRAMQTIAPEERRRLPFRDSPQSMTTLY